jgi:hypothetical protein
VDVLRVAGSTVYAGGDFSSIGGQPRNGLAALDATTGNASSWNPNATHSGGVGAVHALSFSGSTVYVGGGFDHIGGQPRNNLAAVDATSGAATSWNPMPNDEVRALEFGPDGSLWVGGRFTGFDAAPAQSGIARFAP